jgi:hypothetical protein
MNYPDSRAFAGSRKNGCFGEVEGINDLGKSVGGLNPLPVPVILLHS